MYTKYRRPEVGLRAPGVMMDERGGYPGGESG